MREFNFKPMTVKDANLFISLYHRHNKPVKLGGLYAIGLEKDGELIGVAIAGRPVARLLDNKKTLEINRVCVKDGFPNANSILYARMIRVGRLLGYARIITYTLETESAVLQVQL